MAMSKFSGLAFNKLSQGVEKVMKNAMKDAVTAETEWLNEEMKREVIDWTNMNVYSYERQAKSKRRGHSHGGLGDPENYEVLAFFPEGLRRTNDNIQIVFRQKRNITTQGYSWANEQTEIDSDTGLGLQLNLANDLRWVIENDDDEVLAAWKQPYSRPFFEDTADSLREKIQAELPNMVGQIARSLRGQIASQGWKRENWV